MKPLTKKHDCGCRFDTHGGLIYACAGHPERFHTQLQRAKRCEVIPIASRSPHHPFAILARLWQRLTR